ncbi:MAG: TonB-dependent receptor, partial [Fischerella sp.]|nr:TonB-dependent receptor [Fischerella sp.]
MNIEGRRQEVGGIRELLLYQRLNANSFNLRLVGAIAGAVSLALYPIVAKAEYPNVVQEEQQDFTPKYGKDTEKLAESHANLSEDTIDSLLTEQLSVLPEEVTDKISPLSTTTSPAIQPFQPAPDIQLPKALKKLAQNTSPATPPIKILTPDTVVDVPATTVILQFPVGAEVELRVNGDLVDPSLVGRTETDDSTNLVTQTWYGVSLKEGTNTITGQVVGSSEPPVSVQVQVRGAPIQLKLETVETRIPADGRST